MSEPSSARPWWHQLARSMFANPIVDRRRAIFTNRSLRFGKVRAVGFDFDHTLAVYRVGALDKLAMDMVIKRLVKDERVDDGFIKDLAEPAFAVKGLIVDVALGNVLKVDRYGFVSRAYQGRKRLSGDDRRRIYGHRDYVPYLDDTERFRQVDTAFAHPEVLIFNALAPRWKNDDRTELWKLIRHHTDMIHRDGTLKKVVMARPEEYVAADPDVVPMLRALRKQGKTVFLLTNSEWEYTQVMARTAFGVESDEEWLELFDHVVVHAKKPEYFDDDGSHPPAREIGGFGAKVLTGGGILDLETAVGSDGLEVLYVGDHIHADLIKSKRRQHWRTMLVVPELEAEKEARSGIPGLTMQMQEVEVRRQRFERDALQWGTMHAALEAAPESERGDDFDYFLEQCDRLVTQAKDALDSHITQRESLRSRIADATNPYWGSLFRANAELTFFGQQVEDFACTYTSRAANLGLYAADHYFRSAMDFLPHEREEI